MTQSAKAWDAFSSAASAVNQILKTEPTNGPAILRLALYQAKTNSPKNATELLKKAEQAAIGDIDSQLIKARVLAVLHRREEAAETLRSCVRRGATLFEIRSVEDLRSLVTESGAVR
jgi:thioredoxin-like negative regulator of GroEL